MALADFDRDGDLDAVVASMEEPYKLYRNNSQSSSAVTIRLVGNNENKWGVGSTVRVTTELGSHWRTLSSSQGYASANSTVLHFGLGMAKGIKEVEIIWPTGEVQKLSKIAINAHHIIRCSENLESVAAQTAEETTIFREDELLSNIRHDENQVDDFALQPLLPYRLSRLGPGLAWGDVDGDNDLDFFLGQSRTSGSELFLQQGDGSFVKKEQKYFSDSQLVPFKDMGSLFLDADSDGDLDLYVASGGYDPSVRSLYLRDRLFLNQGAGDFVLGLPNTPDLRDASGAVCAADFDRDGDLDLFVGGRLVPGKYPVTPNSRLLVNHAGVFSDQTENLAPQLMKVGLVNSAVWSDYDGDGWIDLLVASGGGSIRVWKNENGKLIEATEDLRFFKYQRMVDIHFAR